MTTVAAILHAVQDDILLSKTKIPLQVFQELSKPSSPTFQLLRTNPSNGLPGLTPYRSLFYLSLLETSSYTAIHVWSQTRPLKHTSSPAYHKNHQSRHPSTHAIFSKRAKIEKVEKSRGKKKHNSFNQSELLPSLPQRYCSHMWITISSVRAAQFPMIKQCIPGPMLCLSITDLAVILCRIYGSDQSRADSVPEVISLKS